MSFYKACQLNLLGVDHDFCMDFNNACAQDLPHIALFEACHLNVEDLCALDERDGGGRHERLQVGLRCRAQAHEYVQLDEDVKNQDVQALHLLLCNTSKSAQRNNTLEWRAHLSQALNTPFEVIYGEGSELIERILFAWRGALTHWGIKVDDSKSRPEKALRYNAFCEKCSDPLCESRLFGLRHL